jgi:hypothetical protein
MHVTVGDVLFFITLAAPWITIAAGFLARNWLKAQLEKGVQFKFDQRIEKLRGELRKTEEKFKADLRAKESEINLLRTTVLTGSAQRQALLDKRRFEAVEKIWTNVNDLASLKSLSMTMSFMKFEAISKEADDPRMQKVLAVFGASAPEPKDIKYLARDERPFVPDLTWAYFSAYTTILYSAYTRFNVLKIGMKDAHKYLTTEPIKKILKAALPHQTEFIEKYEPESYYHLLEELEEKLLKDLRDVLDGKTADQQAATRAKEIFAAVESAKQDEKKEAKVEANA